jgi:hypothetical protein
MFQRPTHAVGVRPALFISLKNALRTFFNDMNKHLLSAEGAKASYLLSEFFFDL